MKSGYNNPPCRGSKQTTNGTLSLVQASANYLLVKPTAGAVTNPGAWSPLVVMWLARLCIFQSIYLYIGLKYLLQSFDFQHL